MTFRNLIPFASMLLMSWFVLVPMRAEAKILRPASPAEYQVRLRYRIYSGRNDRIRQYFELIGNLEKAGFKKDEGEITEPEDVSETYMTGTIAAPATRSLLIDARVKTILLVPAGFALPPEGNVKVQLELTSGLLADRQYALAEQVRGKLTELGFQEFTGYDHRGYTRMIGMVPVEILESLLKDLRWQPTGWLAPETPFDKLPSPLRNVTPIRVIEVLPEPEGFPPPRSPPAVPGPFPKEQQHLAKISAEITDLVTANQGNVLRRMEVILSREPGEEDAWHRALAGIAPELVIEGRFGLVVTLLATPARAAAMAELPFVSTIRLPRAARPQVEQPLGPPGGNIKALQASGLSRLHDIGHLGKGMRLAIIDGDFRGYEAFVGRKKGARLPPGTRLIDLTAERNPNLRPDDYPGDPKGIGHGTACALAAALAAPHVDMTLVRVDPESPHQLLAVARYLDGEKFLSASHRHRYLDLELEKNRLASIKEKLVVERRLALDNFGLDQEAVDKRNAYFKAQADFDAADEAYQRILKRYLDLQKEFESLRNIQIVTSALVWNDGYPLGGASPLTRYLDNHSPRTSMWFQSAGNTRGQVWSGLFRDADGNGVMEFAPVADSLRPGRWTHELNFLAWHPYEKDQVAELPDKARLRFTVQWREAHDPDVFRNEADLYREPLAQPRMVVLRQRDPKGEKAGADEMDVVASSYDLPQRLDNQPTYAVYEQSLEFTTDAAGCYALRIEGVVPPSTRPPTVETIPAMQRLWELRPRVFLDVVDAPSRGQGRVVFLDYPTDLGGLGMPADSRNVYTVGAADAKGNPRDYSTRGPALNLELLVKPDMTSQDGLRLGKEEKVSAFGTSQAVSFAAGAIAVSLEAGTDRETIRRYLRDRLGKPLQAP